ncbi:hypothetical protein HLK59_19955 [Streptomyces sp. S3(2020)]|uniref:hypothetical protein n=1 Tax=Streptomyces sp. S3(2020) TaxID=2732044 RepID=UPI0014880EEC|nr:hypothetical protein [Streptomyces sp. S3(2020)]NNN32596.1 hypothetical protein [Streptomyces sp. S3(2020)]
MALGLAGRVVRRSQGFLEPGEQVWRVVLAQGGLNPWLQSAFFLSGLIGARLAVASWGGPGVFGLFWSVLGAVGGAFLANVFISRRVVLMTDRGVVVLEYGRFSTVKPTRLVARLPLGTAMGPLSGLWARTELAGERLWVHRRWHGSVTAPAVPHVGER